jgi:peptide chain release factor 1
MCETLDLKIKINSTSSNDLGGFREIIAEIRGDMAFAWFKYEGGVHRVQRVPATEKQGRIHTSTVSVAIMPLIDDDSEFKLDMKEVEIIASTSQGAGGQSVNTTYSAIKTKHLPTGIEAQCQDERNQGQNKVKALQILTSRVYNHYEEIRMAKEIAQRRDQVGNADRSEKIRTYNYPQDRITDHRYGKSWNNLPEIMNGGIFKCIKEIKSLEAERILNELV